MVAKALRESGDVEVGPLLDYANNRDLWQRCNALADEAGAYGFVALDLALAFHNPETFAKLVRGEDDPLLPRPVDRCTHTAPYAPHRGSSTHDPDGNRSAGVDRKPALSRRARGLRRGR